MRYPRRSAWLAVHVLLFAAPFLRAWLPAGQGASSRAGKTARFRPLLRHHLERSNVARRTLRASDPTLVGRLAARESSTGPSRIPRVPGRTYRRNGVREGGASVVLEWAEQGVFGDPVAGSAAEAAVGPNHVVPEGRDSSAVLGCTGRRRIVHNDGVRYPRRPYIGDATPRVRCAV
jgi:hypothetical protein